MDILTPELLIQAYRTGYFPMAEDDGRIYWHSPDPRAIFPLDAIKISRSLRKVIAKNLFDIRINTAFEDVMRGCAERESTWISDALIDLYTTLHTMGFAHSVEAWQEGQLVGGLYGVSIGAAFFGESKFSRVSEASKVAFIALTNHLQKRNFILLDSQYINDHTAQLGAIEIPKAEYLRRLQTATMMPISFV